MKLREKPKNRICQDQEPTLKDHNQQWHQNHQFLQNKNQECKDGII